MAGLRESGVLVVDKPRGPTSHDLVAQARRLYRTREVGHAGTLDPMASGVLVLLFGEATKLSAHLTAADKTYRAVVSFGRATDTLDAEGRVVAEAPLSPGGLDRAELEAALAAEKARSLQVPPLFSAISVGGKRAHRVGRSGGSVELDPRPVSVRELSLVSLSNAEACVELRVSKGYYVRALARDLGEHLGIPAHLSELRRLASGCFSIDEAVAWPLAEPAPLAGLTDSARRALPVATLTIEGATRARRGQPLDRSCFGEHPEVGLAAWIAPSGELVAIGEEREPGVFRVVRGFNAP